MKLARWILYLVAALVLLLGWQPSPGIGAPILTTQAEICPDLPVPSGRQVPVATVAELEAAVNNALSGDTILVADGYYALDGVYLRIDTPNVSLRSASGQREAVILDGNYQSDEIVQIVASNVTVAGLTLQEAYNHPIHVMSTAESDTLNTLLYDLYILDPGQQAIKINPVSGGYYTDQGEIACSKIELSDSGREQVRDNCYTGGIDAHQSRDWNIHDNLIEGFWCESGLSEHAIHMWISSRDSLVERNRLVNNARGVGFGMLTDGEGRTYADNPCPQAGGGYVDHYGGLVRNNFIFANSAALFTSESGFDCGICLWQACGAQVLHNTVASTQALFSAIEWRFDQTEVEIANNLVTHNLRDRGGNADLANNLENQPLNLFVNGAGGNLHLVDGASTAIDAAPALAGVMEDIDGQARPNGAAADIGADEWVAGPNLDHSTWLPVVVQGSLN